MNIPKDIKGSTIINIIVVDNKTVIYYRPFDSVEIKELTIIP